MQRAAWQRARAELPVTTTRCVLQSARGSGWEARGSGWEATARPAQGALAAWMRQRGGGLQLSDPRTARFLSGTGGGTGQPFRDGAADGGE